MLLFFMFRITSGPKTTLAEKTLQFVLKSLPVWRDDPDRTHAESEEALNAQLCKFLSVRAAREFPMIHFHHEERQTGTRRVDLSALPTIAVTIGPTSYTKYDPILVFEGKRLPAPTRDREREYVTGGSKKSGGIQRFKLSLHGAALDTAAMIGYVQNGQLSDWHDSINAWISEVVASGGSSEERWAPEDLLGPFSNEADTGTGSCDSVHNRVNNVSPIRLRHMWVLM